MRFLEFFTTRVVILVIALSAGTLSAQVVSPKAKNDKVGFFDGGKKVIDYVYDEALHKYNGTFAVRQEGHWGLVSELGEVLIPCKYDLIRYNWGNKGYIVSEEGKYGVISKTDSLLLPIVYQNIDHYYHDSIALVKDDDWTYLMGPEHLVNPNARIVFKNPTKKPLFDACEEAGSYPDEIKACSDRKLLMHVYGNIYYPSNARENNIQGMVVIGFIIDEQGAITETEIVREIGGGCGDEALRVVKTMGDWIPGGQDGQAVATQFYLPVKFKLE